MNSDQVKLLKESIDKTFTYNCLNKERSFAMQNLVNNVCYPIKLYILNLIVTQQEKYKGYTTDIVFILMVHKCAN